MDSFGKVWAVNVGDEFINRIDPATTSVNLSKRVVGTTHYGYSDMTGVLSRRTTTKLGTWTVIQNSKVEFTPWSALAWHGTNLVVTNIVGSVTNVFTNCTVRVRSSSDQQQWSGWERADNGYPLSATPAGQYLEIEVTLQQLSPEGSPVLYDIAVTPVPQGVADLEVSQSWSAAYAWWPLTNRITVINHGPDDASGLVLTSSLPVGLTFLSAASTQSSLVQSNGLLRWNLGSLANGASLQAEAVVMARNTGGFVSVVGIKSYDVDSAASNNHNSVTLTLSPASCVAVPTGLVAWWPADGNANDIAGTNHGTLANGVALAPGKVELAFRLSGSGAYVKLPDNLFPFPTSGSGTTPFTFETWSKTTADGVILSQQNAPAYGNPNGYVPGVYVGTDGLSRVEVFWRGSASPLISPQPVNDGVFHHIEIVFDRATETAYLDAQIMGNQPHTQIAYSTYYYYELGVGPTGSGWPAGNGGRYPFSGLLDEAALYARALTSTEVQGIYQAGSGGKGKGPVDVRLTITPTPSGVVLRWPSTGAGWQLQYVEALFPGVLWQNEPTPPQLINSAYQLILPASATQRFYRLKSP